MLNLSAVFTSIILCDGLNDDNNNNNFLFGYTWKKWIKQYAACAYIMINDYIYMYNCTCIYANTLYYKVHIT